MKDSHENIVRNRFLREIYRNRLNNFKCYQNYFEKMILEFKDFVSDAKYSVLMHENIPTRHPV